MGAIDLHAATRISELNNPFDSNLVTRVYVSSFKSLYTWIHHGEIEFKNGKTEGKQKFEGDSMGAVLKKMDAFMKELEVSK